MSGRLFQTVRRLLPRRRISPEAAVAQEPASGAGQLVHPDFASLRRALTACLVATVILPLAYLGSVSVGDLQALRVEASQVALRMVRIADEHASKMLDLNNALQARISELIQGHTSDQIRSDRELSARFQELGARYPQVGYIALFDETGAIIDASSGFPVKNRSAAGYPFFETLRQAGPDLAVSRAFTVDKTGETLFLTASARHADGGDFAGAVSIAVRSSYFMRFYQNLVGDGTPVALTLVRDDGLILARWSPGTNIEPAHQVHSVLTPFLKRAPTGVLELRSPIEGGQEIFAYRRVEGYPVAVVAAYPISAIYATWLRQTLHMALLLLGPSLALFLVLALSLRHLRREEKNWKILSEEAERHRALEAARKESSRLQALGNLVGSVAHDFNNLLMAVSANIEVGRRMKLPGFGTQLDNMERAIHRGTSLTRRLLGVARKQPLCSETVSLQSFGVEFGLVRASLPTRIALEVTIPDSTWPIEVDLTEFELAVINVAVNARDAMPERGLFRIQAENVTLDGASVLPLTGDFVRLALTDNGTGMSEEVRTHAFDPLFTTKPMGEGTGLGLAHVRAFCEQSGGTVELDTEVGRGTSIIMYLPRSAQELAVCVAKEPEVSAPSQLSILLVEDNNDVAEAEMAVLAVMDHNVKHVTCAQAALDCLAAGERFDCVLTDVQMPGTMNGIDLSQIIQAQYPGLAVVLVTGFADDLQKAEDLGVPVLPKPFPIDSLEKLLARLTAQADV